MDEVTLKLGENMEVRLESLDMAGYTWKVKNNPPGVVEVKQVKNRVTKNDPPPGKSPDMVFQIQAIHTGKTIVQIEEKRSWEKNSTGGKSFRITVE